MRETIFYTDELNDEFSTAEIKTKKIDAAYAYERPKLLWCVGHFFWYNIVAKPLAKLFLRCKFHHKIVNRDCIKEHEKDGYFLYGNHTNAIADALIPTMVSGKKDAYVVVHPNNVSMPILGRITPYLGALPLPDDMEATKNFMRVLKKRAKENQCIMIYPEAHIWPYYTKIRPFVDTSFRYPVQEKKAVYCFTNTYQKWKKSKTPQIVTYVDGPFYADENRSVKEQKKMLRDQVYACMVKRSEMNNVEIIRYIKK